MKFRDGVNINRKRKNLVYNPEKKLHFVGTKMAIAKPHTYLQTK
jgi:hypothetical protein